MNETDDLIKKLHEILSCSVCLTKFKSPRTLPCQHTFCASCLRSLITEHGQLTCPLCRTVHVVSDPMTPEHQILANNFIVNSIVELNFEECVQRTSRLNSENVKHFERHVKVALNQLNFIDCYLKQIQSDAKRPFDSSDDELTACLYEKNVDKKKASRRSKTNESCLHLKLAIFLFLIILISSCCVILTVLFTAHPDYVSIFPTKPTITTTTTSTTNPTTTTTTATTTKQMKCNSTVIVRLAGLQNTSSTNSATAVLLPRLILVFHIVLIFFVSV